MPRVCFEQDIIEVHKVYKQKVRLNFHGSQYMYSKAWREWKVAHASGK